MSRDRFLTDLYNNMLQKKPVKPGKPFKSLTESYQQVISERYKVLYKKESDPDFSSVDVSDKQFNQAYKYFLVSDEEEISTIDKIKASGLTEAQAKQILSVVLRYRDPNLFVAALNNKVPINEFLAMENVISGISEKYNLDTGLVQELLLFKPATTPSTGPGEAFILLFVEEATKGAAKEDTKAREAGDIKIGSTFYEIKGAGARIKGQKGFGSFTAVARSFTNSLQALIVKSGIPVTISNPNYNIQVNYNGFTDEIADDLIKTGKITKADIVNVYVNGFNEIYENAAPEVLRKWVDESLDQNGRMNQNFKENYFKFALKYYAEQEDFGYMICIGTDPKTKYSLGGLTYLSKADILSGNINGKIAIGDFPSFATTAGQGGGVFAIKPGITRTFTPKTKAPKKATNIQQQ